jgi:hypothetical protein
MVYVLNNALYIQTSQAEFITIYAPNGVKLHSAKVQPGTTTIDAGSFPKGILFVKGSTDWSKKIINQ